MDVEQAVAVQPTAPEDVSVIRQNWRRSKTLITAPGLSAPARGFPPENTNSLFPYQVMPSAWD